MQVLSSAHAAPRRPGARAIADGTGTSPREVAAASSARPALVQLATSCCGRRIDTVAAANVAACPCVFAAAATSVASSTAVSGCVLGRGGSGAAGEARDQLALQ